VARVPPAVGARPPRSDGDGLRAPGARIGACGRPCRSTGRGGAACLPAPTRCCAARRWPRGG